MDDCGLVSLVALLHDVPRLLPGETTRWYQTAIERLGGDGAAAARILNAFAETSAPQPDDSAGASLLSLVVRAEGYSAPESIEFPPLVQIGPLVSSFSHVRLQAGGEPPQAAVPLTPLPSTAQEMAALFPTGQASAIADSLYTDHLRALERALEDVARRAQTFEGLFAHTLSAVERYGWCLPAHTASVSFAEHARLTSALAACLCRQQENEDAFGLLVGDLSGIQEYLYGITAIGPGGVARRLRARSFVIALISDVLGHRVLHSFALPLSCLLMSSGGKFYVLLPWRPDTEEICQRLQAEADRWMLQEFQGVLCANLAWIRCDGLAFAAAGEGQRGFGDVVADLMELLGQRKQRRLEYSLQENAQWQTARFVITTEYPHGECKSCGRFPAQAASDVCPLCEQDARLGSRLPRAACVAYYGDETGDIKLMPGYSVAVVDAPGKIAGMPYLVARLNEPDLQDLRAYPATFRYLANHIPRFGQCGNCDAQGPICSLRDEYRSADDPLFFECIAAHADGRAMLGYLKADVDHLGKIFAFGLKRDGGATGYDSAVQVMMLSRALDRFFSGWMESTISTKYPFCYTVYSGGDDLLIVGPWDQAIALAVEIAQSFGRYVGANPEVTISAGIAFAKDRIPVARASEYAEDRLKEAKDGGRNRISLLGLKAPWEHLENALARARELRQGAQRGATSALLYNLMAFANMYQSYLGGDSLSIRYKALLAYTVARTIGNQSPEIQAWASRLVDSVLQQRQARISAMDELGFVTRYLILARRQRQE